MTSLHVICGLALPPIKNPGYACALHFIRFHRRSYTLKIILLSKYLTPITFWRNRVESDPISPTVTAE